MNKTIVAIAVALAFGSVTVVQAQDAPAQDAPAQSHMDMSHMSQADMATMTAQPTQPAATPAAAINDAEIAHIAYTAGAIDVTAAKQALAKSQNKDVRAFAEVMERDHTAVNNQALALAKKLGVVPQDNATSKSLLDGAKAEQQKLNGLTGAAFDKAYADNEVAYHKAVLVALDGTLIPATQNAELKALLETGSKLFHEHELHAEHLAASLK